MISQVIVVEGKNDTRRLQSFFDVDTIETHGLGISKDTIELIRTVNRKRGVILLLDPDVPGEKIRNKINTAIPGLLNAFILKKDGKTKKKVGIEHASKEVLQEALANLVTYQDFVPTLSFQQFYELGLQGNADSKLKRAKVASTFHLGEVNAKTLYKRLNMLGIDAKQLEEVLS